VAASPESSEDVRVHAVRVLGRSRERVVLETLLQIVNGGRTMLGKPKLAPHSPIVVAAVRTLADTWGTNPQASDMLALARASSDPDIRQAARATRV